MAQLLRIAFCYLMVCQAPIVVAQNPITPNNVFQPADQFYRTSIDTTGFYIGTSGFNTWNFTSMSIMGVDPFPTSVNAVTNSNCGVDSITMGYFNPYGTVSYFYLDSQLLQLSGSCFDQGSNWLYLTYSDSRTILNFPFNFNQFLSDTAIGHVFSNNVAGLHEDRTEHITSHYDAYGELQLPWSTYPNTARVYRHMVIKDTSVNTPPAGTVRMQWISEYIWYDNNTQGPLLTYQIYTDTLFYPNGNIQANSWIQMYALTSSFAGIETENNNTPAFNLYPNPATESVTLILPQEWPNLRQGKIIIKDVQGKELIISHFSYGSGEIKIDTTNLDPGVYLLHLISEDLHYMVKFLTLK